MHLLPPRAPLPALLLWQPGGLQARSAQCAGLGMLCRTWDAGLGMPCRSAYLEKGRESPAGSEGGLATVLCALGTKQWQSLPQRPHRPLRRQFGPEVLGAACEPCLEHTKPRADCLWISALLPTQTYARGEKQAASFQVLAQPPALLPLNCHMKAKTLKVISAVPSTGGLYSKCRRDRILQRGVGWVLLS